MLTDNKKKEKMPNTKEIMELIVALRKNNPPSPTKEVEGIIQDEAFDVIDNAIIDYLNRNNCEEGGQILDKQAKILATRVLAKLSKEDLAPSK